MKGLPNSAQLRAARELAEGIAERLGADVRSVEKAMRGEHVKGAAGKAIASALVRSGFEVTEKKESKTNG